ncbi:effector-binding domain-containing protein [Candidatus Methanophagaceae archaeon]|nr:effector-binding domain-containing protein [Methanophagales archaeon]
MAKSGEVKVKTTKTQEVVWKLVPWVEENGYEIVGPPVAVCHNDSHTALEEELVTECPFPVRKRR